LHRMSHTTSMVRLYLPMLVGLLSSQFKMW
jgi:hypothetical protein